MFGCPWSEQLVSGQIWSDLVSIDNRAADFGSCVNVHRRRVVVYLQTNQFPREQPVEEASTSRRRRHHHRFSG